MDSRYESYCLADPVFYDTPAQAGAAADEFAAAAWPVPAGWARTAFDDWLAWRPRDVVLPPQGWKIHASACLDNAETILAAVRDYCIPRRLAFKFVRSRRLLLIRNGKSADRSASGKFVTIYPADEAQLQTVLTELGGALAGQPGPYILSDLRWGGGPLYVRYGGFETRFVTGPDGERVPAIMAGDGRLVPDRRLPYFEVPPWVTLPPFLQPHLDARSARAELPYEVSQALHFSNSGGVYLGLDRRTGRQVVLKEARPHAGLTLDGADAVTRLRRERDTLERLAGLDAVPTLRDYFSVGEHEFLAQDFVEGQALSALFPQLYPLASSPPSPADIAAHASWVIDICGRVERAVAAVHARGIVIRDLHPGNVLIRPDGEIGLVDWEGAGPAGDPRGAALGDPSFIAPPGLTGVAIDHYALACLRLYLFLPLTTLLRLERGKAQRLAEKIARTLPVPPAFLADAVRTIGGGAAPSPAGPAAWPQLREAMARAILASATPDRNDRLFPGDIEQFAPGGGIDIAHGAAGVLYALDAVGAGRYPEHEDWLIARTRSRPADTPLGFYDGLHGVAYVLDRLGRRDEALELLDACLGSKWDQPRRDLFGGLAGIGLNLAHFAAATGDASLWQAAHKVADRLAGLPDDDDGSGISGGGRPYAGLLRGASGPALLYLRLYEHSRDDRLLDLAAQALRRDLGRCVTARDGTLQVDEGWRTMPYLADGSAGIGMVLDDYLRHRPDERFAQAAAAIRQAAQAPFYVQPGLFYGRAGLLLYLSRQYPPGQAVDNPLLTSQVQDLDLYSVQFRGGLAFPGHNLLRLSMDLASGTAGVILALGAALHRHPVHLPFLGPRR